MILALQCCLLAVCLLACIPHGAFVLCLRVASPPQALLFNCMMYTLEHLSDGVLELAAESRQITHRSNRNI